MQRRAHSSRRVGLVDGLQPLAYGARLAFSGGKGRVTDGTEIKPNELIGGYWILEAESKQQVDAWMQRCPAQAGDVI